MEPRIELLPEKRLMGHSLKMSLANDRTFELWSGFMPKRKNIKNTIGTDLYSIQVYYKLPDVGNFSPDTEFTKWAAVEVNDFEEDTTDLKIFVLPSGLYAVFVHKGRSSDFQKTIKAIYYDWLPSSGYEMEHRPHFELLGEKYKNNDLNSEEEVWVPVRRSSTSSSSVKYYAM